MHKRKHKDLHFLKACVYAHCVAVKTRLYTAGSAFIARIHCIIRGIVKPKNTKYIRSLISSNKIFFFQLSPSWCSVHRGIFRSSSLNHSWKYRGILLYNQVITYFREQSYPCPKKSIPLSQSSARHWHHDSAWFNLAVWHSCPRRC